MKRFSLMVLGFLLGGCVSMGPTFDIDIDQAREKAAQGDAVAQYQLGVAYDYGVKVSKNAAEAATWYRKAAEQGNAAAQNSMGSLYQFGEGVPLDYAEAVRWYQKAVDQGFPDGQANLGYMYDMGLGVRQDKSHAVQLYRTAAENGSVQGMLNLGVSCWQGAGTNKDLIQAYMWLDLARFYTQRSSNMQLKWRARGALDEVKKEMTKDQVRAAKKLVQEWDASHRPD